MNILNFLKGKQSDETSTKLVYASIKALESAIDSEDEFKRYFFSIYHCSPDEDAEINRIRSEIRAQSPDSAVSVGRYFVLWGESAIKALSWYYTEITKTDTLPQEYRDYYADRLVEVARKHTRSQNLPKPIELSEGQLADDPRMNFLATLALMNGQIFRSPKTGHE